MRKIKIALIVILSGLAVFLTVGTTLVINGNWQLSGITAWNRGSWLLEAAKLRRTTEQDMTDVSQLVIDCSNSPFGVMFEEGGDLLVVEEYCTREMKEEEFAGLSVSDGSLNIVQSMNTQTSGFFSFRGNSFYFGGYLKIKLPADAYAALTGMKVSTGSGDISLPAWTEPVPVTELDRADFTSGSGDIRIDFVKAGEILFSTGSGNVSVLQAQGDMKADTSSGDVGADHVKGNVEVSTGSGNVSVLQAQGDMKADTGSGDVGADHVKGNVEVSTGSGNIRVTDVDGSLMTGSSSGSHTIGDVTGNAEMRSGSGDQTLNFAGGNVKMISGSGDLTAGEVSGSLETSSGSGTQRIGTVRENVVMESSSGDQTLESAGGKVNMHSGSGRLHAAGLSKKADMQSTSGDIIAAVEALGEDMGISSGSGNVQITLPEDETFQFSAVTSSGSIRTFFDDRLTFNRRETEAQGVVGDGSVRLNIRTTSGDVTVGRS